MEQELQRIKAEALDAIKGAANQQALQDIRVKYLGKKDYNWVHKWVHIINDRNESQNYNACRFVSISEFRKMKINKICSKLVIK